MHGSAHSRVALLAAWWRTLENMTESLFRWLRSKMGNAIRLLRIERCDMKSVGVKDIRSCVNYPQRLTRVNPSVSNES